MMKNIPSMAQRKTRELSPRRKGLKSFGSRRVGVSKVVDTYAT
jgi:hypothetical protein